MCQSRGNNRLKNAVTEAPRAGACTGGDGNAADARGGKEEGFPCFLAEEQCVWECKKTQD